MIYCLEPELYPKEGRYFEESVYKDENEFEWRIARVENGFFLRYFGDNYFSPEKFVIDIEGEELIKIKNTKCIFVQDANFETFYHFRNFLKNGWTDEIWEFFGDLFNERFENNKDILKSEI
jgi:hypothetical protein